MTVDINGINQQMVQVDPIVGSPIDGINNSTAQQLLQRGLDTAAPGPNAVAAAEMSNPTAQASIDNVGRSVLGGIAALGPAPVGTIAGLVGRALSDVPSVVGVAPEAPVGSVQMGSIAARARTRAALNAAQAQASAMGASPTASGIGSAVGEPAGTSAAAAAVGQPGPASSSAGPEAAGGPSSSGQGGGIGSDSPGHADSGGPNCFVAGTVIKTPDGWTQIQDLKAGDKVMSFSGHGPLVEDEIVEVFENEVDEVLNVNGTEVTAQHRFFTKDGVWREIGQWATGMYLVDANDELVEIMTMSVVPGKVKVYNFHVKKNHTYIADGYRVHNVKHSGGYIKGKPGQEVKETLTAGEYVIRPEAVSALGIRFLDHLNNSYMV